jgi:hypothetical protein
VDVTKDCTLTCQAHRESVVGPKNDAGNDQDGEEAHSLQKGSLLDAANEVILGRPRRILGIRPLARREIVRVLWVTAAWSAARGPFRPRLVQGNHPTPSHFAPGELRRGRGRPETFPSEARSRAFCDEVDFFSFSPRYRPVVVVIVETETGCC